MPSPAPAAVTATMTITSPSVKNVTPSMIVVDTFTLTNTGSNKATFSLAADATFGVPYN